MFPPKPKKERERGVRKPQIAFRVPQHLEDYIEQAKQGGWTQTEVVLRMLELAKDVAEGLGADWFQVEAMAGTEKRSAGAVLAALAKVGLSKAKK